LKQLALALATAGLLSAAPASAGDTKAVIELFTSQGCSSCPAADKLFASYASRDDVLALSYNVDIWDGLGWKDTLASHEYTERQRNYSVARGDGSVYTPQAIVNGRKHVVGSDSRAIDGALTNGMRELTVPVSLAQSGDTITVKVAEGAPGTPHATLWLVMYDRTVTVPVGSGENAGRTITYNDVVRKLRPIAMWKGEEMSIDLGKSEIEQAKVGRCAVLLQTEREGLPGPIIGAATMSASW
jgi:hypothetical protein